MLAEFGRVGITVDGAEVRPRIKKSYELLAYLVSRPNRETSKDDLLAVLFDGRADESAAAYLRQAIIKLRHVLPDGVGLEASAGYVRLAGEVAVTSESVRFEELVAGAVALVEHERLLALQRALALLEEGDYLPSVGSAWAVARRDHLARRAADARHDAADAAYTIGRHEEAWSLVTDVLRADPYREASWRLAMRISGALGRPEGVDGSYERCEATLREIGSEPSPTTRQLLHSLRGR
jgi:DNA-binding SARP family transcriptional activator